MKIAEEIRATYGSPAQRQEMAEKAREFVSEAERCTCDPAEVGVIGGGLFG